eukprot:3481822-Rhodomonas_salina.1
MARDLMLAGHETCVDGTDQLYSATRCAVLRKAKVLSDVRYCDGLGCYAVCGYGATRSQARRYPYHGTSLCARYAMSGTDIAMSATDIAHAAITLRARYAMSVTEIAHAAITLRACYAMSGTGHALWCYRSNRTGADHTLCGYRSNRTGATCTE